MKTPALIEIGRVSSADSAAGMVRVAFSDGRVSDDLPMLSSEYKMPAIGAPVLCLFLSDGPEHGYCLGEYYRTDALPAVTGEGVYYKDIFGEAYIKYDKNTKTLTLHANKVTIEQEA